MNQYEVIDVIATGGMGVVYKARHTLTDRIVAIKLLPSELARDVSNVDRLKLEAKALAQLNHPNIVTTFDFGFSSLQEPFIVIEYVDGESLKEILERDVMVSVDRAVPLFVQIVDAMRFAHTNKILHRDLKPHNIMVTNTPQIDHVKVLDFGVAKMIEETQAITRTGEVVGSPLYMSPEQCIGKPYDQRCDIYSVGVVMYETLTGVVPYRGDNYISTVHLKCSKLAPAFKDVVPGRTFPHELEMIVLRCLEVDPDKRFASMLDLKEELEEVLKNLPKAEHPKALAQSREGRDSTVASTSFSLAEEMSRENASAGAAHGTAYGAGAAASQPANSAGQSQPAASSQTRAGASPPTAFPQESGVSSTSGGGVNSEAGISGVSGVHGSTPTVPNEIAWNASWAVSTDGEAPAEPKMDETWDRIPEVPAWDLLGASGSRRTEDLTSTGKRKPPPLPEQSASAGAPVVSARTGAPFPDQSTPPYAMPTAASTDSQASAPDMVPPANAQSQMSQDDANLSPPAVQTSRGARKSEPQPWGAAVAQAKAQSRDQGTAGAPIADYRSQEQAAGQQAQAYPSQAPFTAEQMPGGAQAVAGSPQQAPGGSQAMAGSPQPAPGNAQPGDGQAVDGRMAEQMWGETFGFLSKRDGPDLASLSAMLEASTIEVSASDLAKPPPAEAKPHLQNDNGTTSPTTSSGQFIAHQPQSSMQPNAFPPNAAPPSMPQPDISQAAGSQAGPPLSSSNLPSAGSVGGYGTASGGVSPSAESPLQFHPVQRNAASGGAQLQGFSAGQATNPASAFGAPSASNMAASSGPPASPYAPPPAKQSAPSENEFTTTLTDFEVRPATALNTTEPAIESSPATEPAAPAQDKAGNPYDSSWVKKSQTWQDDPIDAYSKTVVTPTDANKKSTPFPPVNERSQSSEVSKDFSADSSSAGVSRRNWRRMRGESEEPEEESVPVPDRSRSALRAGSLMRGGSESGEGSQPGKPLLPIVAVAVVLIGGLAFGGLMFFSKKPAPPVSPGQSDVSGPFKTDGSVAKTKDTKSDTTKSAQSSKSKEGQTGKQKQPQVAKSKESPATKTKENQISKSKESGAIQEHKTAETQTAHLSSSPTMLPAHSQASATQPGTIHGAGTQSAAAMPKHGATSASTSAAGTAASVKAPVKPADLPGTAENQPDQSKSPGLASANSKDSTKLKAKKKKKAPHKQAVAKTPESAPAPEQPKRRRAYSTVQSYYGVEDEK